MRFQKYIKEEFYRGIKSNKYGYKEVFINPTPKEMNEIVKNSKMKSTRFAVDLKKHDIFIWPAEILHHEVRKKIKQLDVTETNPNFLFGNADIESGKVKITIMDNLYTLSLPKHFNSFEEHMKIIKKHINWINSKFTNFDDYIKRDFLPSRQSRSNFDDLCNVVGMYL